STDNNDVIDILYKSDSIINDSVILNIIKISQIIIESNLGIKMNILNYGVIPFQNNTGVIEILPNSDTIYNIKEKMGCKLLNYILSKNPQSKISEVINTYSENLAFYSVVTYLLG